MKNYPINLVGRALSSTIVIGGGEVAARKVEGLLDAGAQITVISPTLTPDLQLLADSGRIAFTARPYREGDLSGAFLVIAATGDSEVNLSVWREAKRCGCLINVVDDPRHSDFITPAVVRRGEMSLAISTGGSSPALAHRLRERLESLIEPEYGPLTEILAELRPELIDHFSPGEPRFQAAFRMIDSEILNILRTQGKEAALTYGRERLHRQ